MKPGDIMAIHHTKKERDYTVFDNEMLRNPNLSLKAKGLLAYMLSRPPDWAFSVRGLSASGKDGPDSVRAALQELEDAGYVKRERKREKGKYKKVEYEIYEKPIQEIPAQMKPKKEKSLKGNALVPNTDEVNTDIPNIDENNQSINHGQMERSVREQIEYEIMCQRYDRRQMDNMVSVMAEVMLCTGDTIAVSRDKVYPAAYVQDVLRRVGPMHIEQIMEYLVGNQPEIHNIRGYLLTALINVANTLDMDCQYGTGYNL